MSSKIEKKDLKRIFRRYLAINCMNDYPGQMHNGYTFTMMPALDKIYDDREERIKAKKRHMEYFNITPNIAGFALGISTAMEEENAQNPDFDDTTINKVKTALMGSLSAIGDTLFPATLRILATSLVITMAAAGNVFAPLLFLLVYNVPNYLARWYSLKYGYNMGMEFMVKSQKSGIMDKVSWACTVVGLMAIGAMIFSYSQHQYTHYDWRYREWRHRAAEYSGQCDAGYAEDRTCGNRVLAVEKGCQSRAALDRDHGSRGYPVCAWHHCLRRHKMGKELLVIGAGNIGRGVIGGLFYESGYHLYIYDIMADRMKKLKDQGTYLIERVGANESRRIVVDDFDVLDCSGTSDLIEHLKKIDLAACCVYEGAFRSICESLKDAIVFRSRHNASPLNVLLCVNSLGAPEYFEEKLAEMLENDETALSYLKERTGISQVLVGMAAMPSSDELLKKDEFAVTTKMNGHIGIDEDSFIGQLPQVKQTGGVKKGRAQIFRKVYTGNMKHCMLAFLGKAKGYTFIQDTYDDQWIEDCAFGAFYEADAAVQAEYQFDESDHQKWTDFIVNDPKNRNLRDEISRVAANVKLKLSRENRFVGPALLCIRHHMIPFYLARGIAYGFLYRDESDAGSVEITDYVRENGIEKALETYCGLTDEDWILKELVAAQYEEASKLHWYEKTGD